MLCTTCLVRTWLLSPPRFFSPRTRWYRQCRHLGRAGGAEIVLAQKVRDFVCQPTESSPRRIGPSTVSNNWEAGGCGQVKASKKKSHLFYIRATKRVSPKIADAPDRSLSRIRGGTGEGGPELSTPGSILLHVCSFLLSVCVLPRSA